MLRSWRCQCQCDRAEKMTLHIVEGHQGRPTTSCFFCTRRTGLALLSRAQSATGRCGDIGACSAGRRALRCHLDASEVPNAALYVHGITLLRAHQAILLGISAAVQIAAWYADCITL